MFIPPTIFPLDKETRSNFSFVLDREHLRAKGQLSYVLGVLSVLLAATRDEFWGVDLTSFLLSVKSHSSNRYSVTFHGRIDDSPVLAIVVGLSREDALGKACGRFLTGTLQWKKRLTSGENKGKLYPACWGQPKLD